MDINCALLVDDDPISNFISENVIDQFKQIKNTHAMQSGIEALNFIEKYCHDSRQKFCPGIILLDLNMPEMDGFEFLEKYQNLSFDGKEIIKLVVLTSSTHTEDIDRVKDYNVAGYINKPLTQERFGEVLALLC